MAAIVVVYGQVKDFNFVSYDDPLYVSDNPQVQQGLNLETFLWSFTDATLITGYWVPLVWLSVLLDYQLYGMNAGGFHLTNMLFHILNTVLLFLVLDRMTGKTWRSAFVAALFALHPLHVESVAWVTERKDMLSTFFWMLTLLSYTWYVKRPGILRYFSVFLCLVLGLMSKPMLVTLPFVLLLLDVWPLMRFRTGFKELPLRNVLFRLIREKIPFFILVALFSIMAFLTQSEGGAVKSLSDYPMDVRLANTLVTYVKYIGKLFWPVKLAFLYPHPGPLPFWQPVLAGAGLVFLSLGALKSVKQYPYITTGWLWYLGTLVPVIGIIVIGPHVMADRYTYVPLIGLYVILAWGIPDLLKRQPYKKFVLVPAAVGLLLVLSFLSHVQVGYWRDSLTLYQHAIEVTHDNLRAYLNLGVALEEKEKFDEAKAYYLKIINIDPNNASAYNNLGNALGAMGKDQKAIDSFKEAIRIDPLHQKAWNNLGTIFFKQGQYGQAVDCFFKALKIDPDYAKAHNNMGSALAEQGRINQAIIHFQEALRLRPDFEDAMKNLQTASSSCKRLNEK
ncbi:tetratricopeptide repeat protein [Thermodesulfobacteriota bacterium]